MIPFYILGLLERFGPQHGYQIKKIISDQLADFTQIKLPAIYYHLSKMTAAGLLTETREKSGARPEKTVYRITNKGREAFREKTEDLIKFQYRPVFPIDGIFYFSDRYKSADIVKALEDYIDRLTASLEIIEKHKKETLLYVPDEVKVMVNIIFSHHEHHYRVELDWAEETLNNIK